MTDRNGTLITIGQGARINDPACYLHGKPAIIDAIDPDFDKPGEPRAKLKYPWGSWVWVPSKDIEALTLADVRPRRRKP